MTEAEAENSARTALAVLFARGKCRAATRERERHSLIQYAAPFTSGNAFLTGSAMAPTIPPPPSPELAAIVRLLSVKEADTPNAIILPAQETSSERIDTGRPASDLGAGMSTDGRVALSVRQPVQLQMQIVSSSVHRLSVDEPERLREADEAIADLYTFAKERPYTFELQNYFDWLVSYGSEMTAAIELDVKRGKFHLQWVRENYGRGEQGRAYARLMKRYVELLEVRRDIKARGLEAAMVVASEQDFKSRLIIFTARTAAENKRYLENLLSRA